jgi:adenosylcobinamide amidohydrolase
MSHLSIRMEVILPNGDTYVRESTNNKDPNRLDRRIKSYLKKQGLAPRDVVIVMTVVNMNTGVVVQFTFEERGEWWVQVKVRSFKNEICPYTLTYWCLTEEETKHKVSEFSCYF